jgi:tRNA threonylcarbamoyl adenosine modification protein YeaZ
VVLALDASTYRGTVAVLREGRVLADASTAMRGADEERLMPAVAAALDAAGVAVSELAAIVCGGGPGSFTSLRIAGAIAKGLASATGAPLLAVPSIALVAVAGTPEGAQAPAASERVLATMDAMRGDRYAALVGRGPRRARSARGDGLHVPGRRARRRGGRAGPVPRGGSARGRGRHGARGRAGCARSRWRCRTVGGSARAAALALAPVSLAAWEPDYGRKAEAQVQWELAHGRALPGGDPHTVAGYAVERA